MSALPVPLRTAEPPKLDCLWAALCLIGTVCFIFRA